MYYVCIKVLVCLLVILVREVLHIMSLCLLYVIMSQLLISYLVFYYLHSYYPRKSVLSL